MESRSEDPRSTSRRSRPWLWVPPLLLAAFVTYAWASISLSTRQTRALAERIRLIYGLPPLKYGFPIHYLDQVVKAGMTHNEVQVALRPLHPLVKRVSWHTDLDRGGRRWVAERLVLEVPWTVDYPLDIFFRDGLVWQLDTGYYITPQNQISADSAARLLIR